MKRILFVTTRNILTSSGELRLIKNRAESLYREYGIATDFIAIQTPDRIAAANKENINSGGTIKAFPAKFSNPFQSISSYRRAYKEVEDNVLTGKYCTLVFSGNGLESWAKRIKKVSNIKVLYDIHGANEDLVEVARKSGFIKKCILNLLYYKQTFCEKMYLSYADGALVVTKALEEYTRKRYKLSERFKFYIIPCATSSLGIENDEYQEYRIKYRQKYGIKDDEVAFIYSGGISPWQCIEETIEVYRKLQSQIKQKSKLLIFSFNIDAIKHLLEGIEVIHDRYSPDELSKALCAGDYAFLLRQDNLTNNVAFPNKFLEYVQGGMKIITTPYVYEISQQVQDFEFGILYDFSTNLSNIVDYIDKRTDCHEYDKEYVDKVLIYNSFSTRTKELALDIMENENPK